MIENRRLNIVKPARKKDDWSDAPRGFARTERGRKRFRADGSSPNERGAARGVKNEGMGRSFRMTVFAMGIFGNNLKRRWKNNE
jgi:hypothetical protein